MQAAVLDAPNQPPVIRSVAEPELLPGEVLISLRASALNHRDVWIQQGKYAGLRFPIVPGSDGAGVVSSVGWGVDAGWIGREVIINPGCDWGDDPRAQSTNFTILGLPRDGTFAERVAVPVSQVHTKPEHLEWTEAAALPLAGLTAYRAVFSRGGLSEGERVLITGIGAGTALFALQFAVGAGARVFVTSSSQEKIDRAKALGALGGVNYREADWPAKLEKEAGKFDLIIDSAVGPGFNALVDLAKPGARIVFFGATAGAVPELNPRPIFWKQLSILGTTMGNPEDFAAMMQFVLVRELRPVVSDTFPLSAVADAFALMERGGQSGKIVLTV
jgi:NADPH:quinone reductase-like Zn-dependent oxidoreductase